MGGSLTTPEQRANDRALHEELTRFVARAIAAHERGEALRNLYDHDRGY